MQTNDGPSFWSGLTAAGSIWKKVFRESKVASTKRLLCQLFRQDRFRLRQAIGEEVGEAFVAGHLLLRLLDLGLVHRLKALVAGGLVGRVGVVLDAIGEPRGKPENTGGAWAPPLGLAKSWGAFAHEKQVSGLPQSRGPFKHQASPGMHIDKPPNHHETMGVNITTMVYLRRFIIQTGSIILLMGG